MQNKLEKKVFFTCNKWHSEKLLIIYSLVKSLSTQFTDPVIIKAQAQDQTINKLINHLRVVT